MSDPYAQESPRNAHRRRTLRECHDCGMFQRIAETPDGKVARCVRCNALLRRARTLSLEKAGACAGAAALLFVFALWTPLLALNAAGRLTQSTVFTGPEVLNELGLRALGIVVVVTLLVAPAVKLAILIFGALGVRMKRAPKILPWVFGWLDRLSPWAMVEVYILGVVVAYTRLRALASVDIGPALFALTAVMIATAAADASLDHDSAWAEIEARAPLAPQTRAPGGRFLGCHACGRVNRARDGEKCERCAHPLHARKHDAIGRTWALLISAALLYVPANVLPVMVVKRLGRGGANTILGGVVELLEAKMWPLAALVFMASVVVPITKLVTLGVMLVMTQRGSRRRLYDRTRVFRAVHWIGRWSMIDIFMLTTLVSLVRMGFLATILPGYGALAFCGVVVLTMFATQLFDPRIMWDVAKKERVS